MGENINNNNILKTWNRNFVRPTGCVSVSVSVCESVCPFIFSHISSGTRYFPRVVHIKSVELLLSSANIFYLFYLINILQFYNLKTYVSTRTNILLVCIHKLYNLIDVFVLLSKKCRKE